MSFTDRGAAPLRILRTQQASVVGLSNFSALLPLNQLATQGFLRGLRIGLPYMAGTVGAGSVGNTAPSLLQQQQLRQIQSIQLTMQGIGAIWQLNGLDLLGLNYVGAGQARDERKSRAPLSGYSAAAAGALSPWFVGVPGVSSAEKLVPVVEYAHAGPVFNLGFNQYLPLTEIMNISGAVISGQPQGNAPAPVARLGDRNDEVGMIMMQSNSQNVTLQLNLSPLYGADYRSVIVAPATNFDTLTATEQWTLENHIWDVPTNAADWPSGRQLGTIVTRTAREVPISGGQVDYVFAKAGLLGRAYYYFFNDTTTYGTLVDIFGDATQTPDKIQIEFSAGLKILKYQNTAHALGLQMLSDYGTPAPGILVHDLMRNGQARELQDTGALVQLQTQFTGLPASITRMRVVEDRLIPVLVTTQGPSTGQVTGITTASGGWF